MEVFCAGGETCAIRHEETRSDKTNRGRRYLRARAFSIHSYFPFRIVVPRIMSFEKLIDVAKSAGGLLHSHWGKLLILAFLFISNFEVSFKWGDPTTPTIEAPSTEQ